MMVGSIRWGMGEDHIKDKKIAQNPVLLDLGYIQKHAHVVLLEQFSPSCESTEKRKDHIKSIKLAEPSVNEASISLQTSGQ